MIKRMAIGLLAFAAGAHADVIILGWSAVDESEDGTPIPTEAIQYRFLHKPPGGEFSVVLTTEGLEYKVDAIEVGCHEFAVKSFRTDSGQVSKLSNVVRACVEEPAIIILVPKSPELFMRRRSR